MTVRHDLRVLAAVVATLHAVGWGALAVLTLSAGGAPGLATGAVAYTLGLRHAFDPDHLAAIDSTTRRLVTARRRSLPAGLAFSLGHCSVVVALCLLVALGFSPGVGIFGELIGPGISGTFLAMAGAVNLMMLTRRRDRGPMGGLLTRLFAPLLDAARRPWHLYPVGVLFGLGFDTATEILLLALAGGQAARGAPVLALLCLPLLFAAGMTLGDGANGVVMAYAYRSERMSLVRATTLATALLALAVGGVELLALAAPG